MTSNELVLYGKGKGKSVDDPLQRKLNRRTIDYGSNVVRWLGECLAGRVPPQRLQSHYSYTRELMPPFATPQSPYDSICCRFVHSATNKNRAPVNVVHWFPNGRRLISGTQTGEMTIWNGFQFHFENIMQAHNAAVRAMQWTPEETVLVSGDQLGVIKFWDQYMYNFQTFQGHKESICDITISPTGTKFCSCADDSHAKVWDLRTAQEERAFTGHGWDVKCCHWHPTKGLVATGSKDAQIKLWDPRASEAITTIFCHKNTVTRVMWSPNGQYLASGSRDQLIMLTDIRTMSVRKVFKAHQKEVTALCWHPDTDALLASGGYDANIHFWDTLGGTEPIETVNGAHEGPIWSLSWHPLGHLLVSGSHDYSTRFWSRARPGDTSWEDILPKKIGLGASEAAALIVPQAPLPTAVYETGIFAEPSPDYKAPVIPEGGLPLVPLLGKAAEGKAQALEKPTLGLSFGEGANRKDVLDTSDFDALEEKTLPLEKTSVVEVAAGKTIAPFTEKAVVVENMPEVEKPVLPEKSAPIEAAAPRNKSSPSEKAALDENTLLAKTATEPENARELEDKVSSDDKDAPTVVAALKVSTAPSPTPAQVVPKTFVAPVPLKVTFATALPPLTKAKAVTKAEWKMAPKLGQQPKAAPESKVAVPVREIVAPELFEGEEEVDPLRAMALAQADAAEGPMEDEEFDSASAAATQTTAAAEDHSSGVKRQAETEGADADANTTEAKRLRANAELLELSET